MSDYESEGEVEVIEVKAANSLVPNLTISVEKDDDEATVEFQEEDKQENTEENKPGVEVKLTDKAFSHTKIYENKVLKDIGLTVEEARSRKKSRAKRFQSPMLRDEQEIDEVDQKPVEELMQKVKVFNEENGIFEEIRLDAVHLRGLDDMSTDDIFKFFADHFPSHIEWIDDTSCNIVWKDETSAAGAILAMSRPNRSKSTEEKAQQSSETKPNEKKIEDDDELDLMDSGDDEEMEVEEGENKQEEQPQVPFVNELRRCKTPFVKKGKKTLLKIRFANVNDKKTAGGANKSQYYRKYGNPNYGNVKGILSRSFKKRYHGKIAKREFEELQPEEEIPPKKKLPTKRLYSEQAWYEAKKARQDSESSSEDEKSRTEREDQELINSSVRDLDGAIPVTKNERKTDYDSMEADNESRKEAAEKRNKETSSSSGTLTVQVKGKGSVWDRLGNQSVGTGRKLQQDSTLPKSLQDRLGTR